MIFKLFLSIKSRSVEDGIDKEGFHHFCQMPVSSTFFDCIPECIGSVGTPFLELVYENTRKRIR